MKNQTAILKEPAPIDELQSISGNMVSAIVMFRTNLFTGHINNQQMLREPLKSRRIRDGRNILL